MEDSYHLGVKALVKNAEGKYLLLKVNPKELTGSKNTNKDYWDLPGGRVHRGSSVDETLIREVEEELGVSDVTVVKPLGMVLSNIRIPLKDGNDVGLILSIYECTIPDDATIILSFEHLKYEWFSPLETAKLLQVKYPKDFCELIAQM